MRERTTGKNSRLLDGLPVGMGSYGKNSPAMDAMQEIAVQQNSVDAVYSFSAGATLSISIDSRYARARDV